MSKQKQKSALQNTIQGIFKLPFMVGVFVGFILFSIQSSSMSTSVMATVNTIVTSLDGTIFVSLLLAIALVAGVSFVWVDYKLHKTPLTQEDPNVMYSFMHHMHIAVLPQLMYYRRNLATVMVSGTLAIFVCAIAIGFSLSKYTSAYNASEFVTTWKTDNPGASSTNQITIPTGEGEYNYTVRWGDETVDKNVTGSISHTYSSPGVYEVRISGEFPHIKFANSGDKDKILAVNQWGSIEWESMEQAFMGAKNLSIAAQDSPILTNVKSMSSMFSGATSFDSDISAWDVSTIRDMSFLFRDTYNMNKPLDGWDVKNVTNMRYMFANAKVFNQPLTSWNISKVQDMYGMFYGAEAFNRGLDKWDTSSVRNMTAMFYGAKTFNQSLDNWNIARATTLEGFFERNDQMSVKNYDKTLSSWAQQDVQKGVVADMGQSAYCQSSLSRQILIGRGWTINDAGKSDSCNT